MEAAYERKKSKYLELAAECWGDWLENHNLSSEVGCRGYVGLSNHTPSEGGRSDRRDPKEGNQRASGGG